MTTTTLAQLLIAIIIIAFVTSLAVEVEKKICNDFPNNILAICTSIVITVLAAIAYICYAKITVTPVIIIGIIVLCIAEAYIAMFGYDKFIQMIKQYKKYIDESKEN